jgi:hypothetical protein
MTSTAQDTADHPAAPGQCWCCGNIEPEQNLVHLGNHPEVAVCTRCAHSLHTWAWAKDDQAKSGAGVRARNAFRRLRRAVMEKGWHRSRLIGQPLRWLGKHLP